MDKYNKKHSCTLFPDHFLGLDLTFACDIHDEHYGNKNVSREEADIQLRENVKSIGGIRAYFTAYLMWIGIRLFGWMKYE